MIVLIPLYILPTEEKLAIINRAIADKALIALEPDVILPQGWGTLARVYYGILITIAEFILLYKWTKRNGIKNVLQKQSVYVWVLLFTSVSSILCILLVIEYFFHLSRFMDLTQQILFSLSGIILFVSLYLLFKPNLLYGLNPDFQVSKNQKIQKEKKISFLSTAQKNNFKPIIESHFDKNVPFIKMG